MTRLAPAIVLVRPTEEGNVGSVARAMANMGLGELILVEPAVEIGTTARALAVGAAHVLDAARRLPDLASALAPFRRVVATTSTRDRSLPGPILTPRELPAVLAADPPETPTVILFGPERSGLTTDELARASPLVRIPAHPVQPTLNLAQAVLIVAYELHLGAVRQRAEEAEPAAAFDQVEGLYRQLEEVLPAIGFARDDTAAATARDLRRFLARARPSERDVSILRGICRRILGSLERRAGPPAGR